MQVTPATAVRNMFVFRYNVPKDFPHHDMSGFHTRGYRTSRTHQVAWMVPPISGIAFSGFVYFEIFQPDVSSFELEFDLLSRCISDLDFFPDIDDYVRDCGRYFIHTTLERKFLI